MHISENEGLKFPNKGGLFTTVKVFQFNIYLALRSEAANYLFCFVATTHASNGYRPATRGERDWVCMCVCVGPRELMCLSVKL